MTRLTSCRSETASKPSSGLDEMMTTLSGERPYSETRLSGVVPDEAEPGDPVEGEVGVDPVSALVRAVKITFTRGDVVESVDALP